jgi:hypothetical protein
MLLGVRDRQVVDVLGCPASGRLGSGEVVVVGGDPAPVGVDVEQPLDRMTLEQHESAGRGEEPRHDRGPRVEVLEPEERPAPRVHEVGAAIELVGRVEHIGEDPAGGRARGRRQALRQVDHPGAVVDPDHLRGPQVPQRERVAATGALEVDRAAAVPVQVADELDLNAEQVRPTRTDQGHGLR